MRPNKTIIGVGSNADDHRRRASTSTGSYNVIVRNLSFTDAEDDAINVGQSSHHIWIDHNTFVRPVDGSVDIVRGADYVTVSWNHFDHTDKTHADRPFRQRGVAPTSAT